MRYVSGGVSPKEPASPSFCPGVISTPFFPFPCSKKQPMKIRGLLAGLLVAAALTGCTSSATAPETHTPTAAVHDGAPPPADTTANRGGGAMGTGT
jgi:hypothetical protein